MMQNFDTIQARSASTLLCTFAASTLIPTALHYTTNYANLSLLLAVSLVWIVSLARMWMVLLGSVRMRFDRRAASAIIPFEALAAKSAEVFAACTLDPGVLIPGTAPEPMTRLAGA